MIIAMKIPIFSRLLLVLASAIIQQPLVAQPCIPSAAATVAGMVPGTSGNYSFMNVPTGRVIQLTADQANTSYLIDMCATNAGNNVPSGTNDCYLTILSANGPGATALSTLDDGCPNMAAPGYGPAVGTWVAPAAGTYFIYLTEYNAAGSNNCISNGNNANYDFSITVTAPPSYDAAVIYDNVEYTAIPRYQIGGGGLSLGGVVSNLGASAFTGITMAVSVATAADPGTSIFSVTGSPSALGIGQTATFTAGSWVPPAGTGDYILTYTATTVPSDGNAANDTWVRNLSLTGDYYARDNDQLAGGLGINGFGVILQGAEYTFLQSGQIKEVNTVINGGQVGDTVQLEVYQLTAGVPGATPVATSNIAVLNIAAPGDVTFEPSSPFMAMAGTAYVFAIRHHSRGVNIGLGYADAQYIPGRNWINIGTWDHPESFNFQIAYIIRPAFQVCTEPEITVAEYDCADNSIAITVTNAGSPGAGSSYALQLNGEADGAIPFSTTGTYTFTGLSPDQSYFIVATDGNGSCDVFSDYLLTNACQTLSAGCTQVLTDGGLEQPSGSVWSETFTDLNGVELPFPVVDASLPLLGLQSAWFGGNGIDGSLSSISQNFTLPANSNGVNLTFWGIAIGCSNPDDYFEVSVDGAAVATIQTSTNGFCDDENWHRYAVDLNGLSPGSHALTFLFQQNGVSGNANFFADDIQLEVCACPTLNLSTSSTPSACALSIGTATAMASGGSGPYTYVWSDNQMTATATGLSSGLYGVTVTDSGGCSGTATVTVSSSDGPVATYSQTNVACVGVSNGSIDLEVSGGSAPYTYDWSNDGPEDPDNDTPDLFGLAAGAYSCTITDFSGCSFVVSTSISQPSALVVSGVAQDVACNGQANGSVDLIVSGGTPGYSYSWNNGAGSQDLSGLDGGLYAVTVSDSNGCTFTSAFTIEEPSALTIGSIPEITHASCADGCDGSVSNVLILGGTPPYTYDWSNGGFTPNLENLCPGSYTGTVTDANFCTFITPIPLVITSPPAIFITGNITNSTGSDNGAIDITVGGGTGAYTYEWSNGMTTQDVSGLAPGIYSVIVTDANGCELAQLFEVILLVSSEDLRDPTVIRAFPNPAVGRIWVDVRLPEVSDLLAEIVDITGRVLSIKEVSDCLETRLAFDLTTEAEGIYLIRVTTNRGASVQKIVLTRD